MHRTTTCDIITWDFELLAARLQRLVGKEKVFQDRQSPQTLFNCDFASFSVDLIRLTDSVLCLCFKG